jgi:RNA polymerase sigma-70 factor (ECF subfamily)
MASATDKEREIHKLILSKDDLAFAKFCDEYYELIYDKVLAFNKIIFNENETLIIDVVTDTFLKYFRDPDRYDPEKQTLERFLIMDAEGDVKNEWEKWKRQTKNFRKPVELNEENGNSIKDGSTPFENLIDKENTAILDKKLKELFPAEKDIQIAHLMLSGERRTTEYVKILKIENKSPEEQKQEVKKHKDRIDKVIKRKFRTNE